MFSFFPISSIFSHRVVTFQIGPSKKEYRVSKPLFVHLSPKFINGFPSGTYGYNNVELVDWSSVIDEDVFNLLVQFAYTGGYDLPRRNELLGPTNDARRAHYWIYQGNPLVANPCPASTSRQHAQVWALAMLYDMTTLAEVAAVQLRASLVDMTQHVVHRADMAEDKVREVVDVIGYIYHHGSRFWRNEVKTDAPLHGMRLTIAWFARKYLCKDFGNEPSDGRQQQDRKVRNLKMWTDLLEREPRIAVDIVCHDPKSVTW